MSLAIAQGTSLFIIERKAHIEYRLMQITNQLSQLAMKVTAETSHLLQQFTSQVASSVDTDESAVIADVMSNDEYIALYDNITLQYKAKEQLLTMEKQQLETQQKALDTQSEHTDSLIQSGIKQSFAYMSS